MRSNPLICEILFCTKNTFSSDGRYCIGSGTCRSRLNERSSTLSERRIRDDRPIACNKLTAHESFFNAENESSIDFSLLSYRSRSSSSTKVCTTSGSSCEI